MIDMKPRAKIAIAALCLVVAQTAAAATVVSGTVTDAAGDNISGTAIISWPSFIEPGGEMVVGGSLKTTITDGALSVTLAPNTGSTPSGTSYSVRIQSSDRKYQTTDAWVVPNAASATIAEVRTSNPPTASAVISLTAISTVGISVGDILTAQSGPTWARLAAGSESTVLVIASGAPAWAAISDAMVPDTITLTSVGQAGDVDASGSATGDILKFSGSAYAPVNILAAVGEELVGFTVPYKSGGVLSSSASFNFNGDYIYGSPLNGAARIIMSTAGSAAAPTYTYNGDTSTGIYRSGAGAQSFSSAGVNVATIGGARTALFKEPTGPTDVRCEDGSSQGVTPCLQVESFAAFDGVAFSELSTQANGSYAYCTDCTKATPCASGGSGAFAKRINGAWDCD